MSSMKHEIVICLRAKSPQGSSFLLNLSNFISLYADNYEYTLSYLSNMFFGRILLLLAGWYTFKDTNKLQVILYFASAKRYFRKDSRTQSLHAVDVWFFLHYSCGVHFTFKINPSLPTMLDSSALARWQALY